MALTRGFDDVRLLTWPIAALQAAGLPLKPLDRLLPYSAGITVERPEPVGDYRVPDGRYLAGLVGRLVELFAEPVPDRTCLSMYLAPHAEVVVDAVNAARAAGLAPDVRTMAKAVGSDVTNVIRSCLREGRFGAAVATLSTFLANDEVVAVSEYTRDEIIAAAEPVDAHCGTGFAGMPAAVGVSYPPIDSSAFLDLGSGRVDAALARRGLARDGYVLFLSRVARAKGIHDLVDAYARRGPATPFKLVVAGTGPALEIGRRSPGGRPRSSSSTTSTTTRSRC